MTNYFTASVTRKWGVSLGVILIFCGLTNAQTDPKNTMTTIENMPLFAKNSLWNSRPSEVTFWNATIPDDLYKPAILSDGWSTGIFFANETDTAVLISGRTDSGLWNPDTETAQDVWVSHWPNNVVPASQSDGHADIVDVAQGVIHSFWQLKKDGVQWRAQQYTWTPLGGMGWGDPAHYFQGARATGVPTSAGLIRRGEARDNAPYYSHALAISLTKNALSPRPAYIYPATSADTEARDINKGFIAQGTRLMLPSTFDLTVLSDPDIKKIAATLQRYGAYVVDRNDGTPFILYAEKGSGLDIHKNGWNNRAVQDLEAIQHALRPVATAGKWLDADDIAFSPNKNLNILSLRGPWENTSFGKAGRFDSRFQALVFDSGNLPTTQKRKLPVSITNVVWAVPEAGQRYQFKVAAAGNVTMRLSLPVSATNSPIDSGFLNDGGQYSFTWPSTQAQPVLEVANSDTRGARISATLTKMND